MNGPYPRGSIRPKSGWSLMKKRSSTKAKRQEAFLAVTNSKGDSAAHKMSETDCIELATVLLEHVRGLRQDRTKK